MTAPTTAAESNRQGLALAQAGKFAEASACFARAAEIDPSLAEAHNNLGAAHLALGQFGLAVPALEAATRLEPGNVDAHFNLGIASWRSGQPEAGIRHFIRVTALAPGLAEAHHNLGILLSGTGRFEEAAASFQRTIALRPDFGPAHENLGVALVYLRRQDEAIASLTRALELGPDNAMVRAQRMYLLARNCDWDALADDRQLVPQLGVTMGIVPPFGMIAFEDEPNRHLIRAQRFAAAKHPDVPATVAAPRSRPERLRIGYFSADFSEHAVMQVAAPLFESHDRERFTIHAYSYGPPSDDAMRRRLVAAFDGFIDIAAVSDEEAVAKARADGVGVAVDLMGHTLNSRLGIFARRAAPVQVTYLGHPGTSGLPAMDYILADATVIPDETANAYTEKRILLPNSYQTNGKRKIAATHWTRAMAGLPETGFVFACFNNSYKITPREFDIWMDLVRRVEGSVLWLVGSEGQVERNLGKEAARRGVDPARLVFAPRVAIDEYLARQRLADLALDTFAYNGHSTASDTLWAGLPLVTRMGRGLAARVSASLLGTLGLPDLVTSTDEGYAALALELATDPERLAGIRAKLAATLDGSPLYDAPLFARHLETAFDLAFERAVKGEPTADIVVPA